MNNPGTVLLTIADMSQLEAEVEVDEELGVVRVTRIVDAVAAGRILNTKTARSQILGGVVMFLIPSCTTFGCRSSHSRSSLRPIHAGLWLSGR